MWSATSAVSSGAALLAVTLAVAALAHDSRHHLPRLPSWLPFGASSPLLGPRLTDLQRRHLTEEEYRIATLEGDDASRVELLHDLLVRTGSDGDGGAAVDGATGGRRGGGNENGTAGVHPSALGHKFRVGDVVEQVYNANTVKSRMLHPFRVADVTHDRGGSARYALVRLGDGRRVESVPESFLRGYVPYPPDSKALCSVDGGGGVVPTADPSRGRVAAGDVGRERLVSCTIVSYVSSPRPLAEDEGASYHRVREAEYRVRISGGDGAEEEVNLAAGKLQRRFV